MNRDAPGKSPTIANTWNDRCAGYLMNGFRYGAAVPIQPPKLEQQYEAWYSLFKNSTAHDENDVNS